MRNIDGTVILVTGATDGLGKRVARDLATKGATVLLHGRDPVRGDAAARELRDETGTISCATIWPISPRSMRCAG